MSTEPRSQKIYTRTGDQGKTSLIGGSRVSKSDSRIGTYGTVDELNSVIGILIYDLRADFERLNDTDSTYDVGAGQPAFAGLASAGAVQPTITEPDEAQRLIQELQEIQSDLFNIGSQLACEDEKLRAQMPNVSGQRIDELEKRMDEFSLHLKPLKNFILPGGCRSAATAHLARTVCRRAERLCVLLHESELKSELAHESTKNAQPLVTSFLNRLSDYFFVLARFLNFRMRVNEPVWRQRAEQ